MKSFEEEIKKLQKIGMTQDEKEFGRQKLSSFIDTHTLVSSPYTKWIRSPYVHHFFKSQLVKGIMVVALVFVVSGSGLTFASENALPGDALYGIKINFTEKIATVLAFNTESKARWQAKRVETRLKEIDMLKTEGRLGDGLAIEAENAFKDNSDALSESLTKLTLEGNHSASVEIVNTLRPSLEESDPENVAKTMDASIDQKTTTISGENPDSSDNTADTTSPLAPDEKTMTKSSADIKQGEDIQVISLQSVIHQQKEKILAQAEEKNNDSTKENTFSSSDNSTMKENSDGSVSTNGILKGKVEIGPNCPVEKIGVPCLPSKEAYTSREVVVYTKEKHEEVTRTHLKEDGTYIMALPKGGYTVEIAKNGIDRASSLPKDIVIEEKATIELNFSIDTGIR